MSRGNEFVHFGEQINWLPSVAAQGTYKYVSSFCSTRHYGLDPGTVTGVERHKISSLNVAKAWLRERIPDDGASVRVVFGRQEAFNAPTAFFLDSWSDLFGPGRDDVVIFGNEAPWILFYCHEDVLELGVRGST